MSGVAPGPFPVTPPLGVNAPGGFSIYWGMDNKLKTPYSHVFNFSITRDLGHSFAFEATYVGRLGRHLLQETDLGMPEDRITGRSPAEKTRNYFERFRWVHERFHLLAELPQPVIMAIHGYCLGAGLEVAMMGDIRIAADDARFGIPAARLGLGYHYSGLEQLMALVGPSVTKEIFFTARTDFSAQDALRMGLVNQVVPKAELEAFTRNYALTMAKNAPLTLRSAKATVEQLVRPDGERDLAMLEKLIADCFNSQDYQEGVKAFSEKRRPQFQGR